MHRNLLPPQPSNTHLGFTLHGSGPEHVLVMHDWLGDHTNYDAILPYLDSTAFTYAFVDLRGYGLSMHLAGAVTINEIATDSFARARWRSARFPLRATRSQKPLPRSLPARVTTTRRSAV